MTRSTDFNRRPKLHAVAVLISILPFSGCKNPPGILNDIGNAVDRAAKTVVDTAANVVDGSKRKLPPPAEGEDDAVTEARAAYDAGKVAFQTAEYVVAVEKFRESFAAADRIADPDMKIQVQSTLYFNLGHAQLKAYEVDQDRNRLNQARDLFRNYLGSDQGVSETDRVELERVIAEIDAKLAGPTAGEADGEAEAALEPAE